MKFSVLALDYDGTIAEQGRPDPAVMAALRAAQAKGIVIVLVTGRILEDLRKVAGDLSVFEAIVAENGAVLAFPNRRDRVLGRAPPASLLAELRAQSIEFAVGACVLEADASFAIPILQTVRLQELPLVLVFNRSRVMLLPQGISKATGLREALNTLRLSLHNCIGIGDAENDFQLLEAAEIGVAAGWGSASLRTIADVVVPGNGPSSLAGYLRELITNTRMPATRVARHHVLLGHTAGNQPLEIPVSGRMILVAGDPRSGKSWVTGLFCEQLLLQGYCLCIIDPEGDYGPLESLPGMVRFGGDEVPPRLSDIARALRYPDVSVVIDLSHVTHPAKVAYIRELLPMVAELRRKSGQPHWIVVDEAHYFLPDSASRKRLDLELTAYMLVTHRVSNLHPDLLKEVDSIIVTQITDWREAHALANMYGRAGDEQRWHSLLRELTVDAAALLPRVGADEPALQRFTVAPRMTPHVRHRSKYLDVPMAQHHGFVFTDAGKPVGAPVRTLRDFVTALHHLPSEVINEHVRRGDFSRWIGDVFGDQPLATEIRTVEREYRHEGLDDPVPSLIRSIHARYELEET
jgi:hydroxymethylpyrimidine pyrophosphatase-like HAD family hydrolase